MNGENKVKVVEMKGKQVYTYLPNAKTLVFDESNMEEVEETQVMSARLYKLHKGMKSDPKVFIPIFLISPIPFVTFTPQYLPLYSIILF